MDAEALELFVNNDQPKQYWTSVSVRALRRMFDEAAERVAAANADWHDDPESEDHAEYHAPADVQFPREVRDEAILSYVRYRLTEETLQDAQTATR